jgi:hypothetical protein
MRIRRHPVLRSLPVSKICQLSSSLGGIGMQRQPQSMLGSSTKGQESRGRRGCAWRRWSPREDRSERESRVVPRPAASRRRRPLKQKHRRARRRGAARALRALAPHEHVRRCACRRSAAWRRRLGTAHLRQLAKLTCAARPSASPAWPPPWRAATRSGGGDEDCG